MSAKVYDPGRRSASMHYLCRAPRGAHLRGAGGLVTDTVWHILAPGPSASASLAEALPRPLGVVTSAFQLAPWADFLAATDMDFWRKVPAAKEFAGRRFAIHIVPDTERIIMEVVNSGVLALEAARRLGATEIHLHGFDLSGSHYFGPYTNGLKNTPPDKRAFHIKQFRTWQKRYGGVAVINRTAGSALPWFPYEPFTVPAPQLAPVKSAGWMA